MTAIQHKTRKKWPDIFNGYEVRLTPLRETLEGEFRPAVLILTATAGCLLLLTCASLANLLIARSAAHEREMAVRTALGASRFDLAIRVLLSNLILALAGAALGWALCRAAIIAIVHLEPVLGGLKGIEVDSLANFALCLVLSLATALLVSAPIILGVSHTTIHNSLKDGGRGGTSGLRRQRIRGLLVSAEVALAVSLLVVSGLLARSFVGLMSTDLGFTPDNVLLLESNIGDSYYNTNAKRLGYFRPLLQGLQGVPGVVSIGGMRYFPMHARLWTIGIGIKENPASNAQQPIVYWNRVAGDYFNAMRIPLIAGRLPSANEMWGDSENVLINATAAQAFFRNADEAVGKHIQLGMQGHEVIGVVGSVRQAGLGRPPGPEVYSLMGADESTGILTIAIRTRQRPDRATIQSIAAVVQHYDNTQTRPALIPLDTFLSDTISARRTAARLGLAFAFVSLGLAALGVYGLVSYSVTQRTAEFGIRAALGASRRDLIRLVMTYCLRLAGIGILVGLAGTLLLSRLIASFLYGIPSFDPATFAGAAFLLLVIALAAASGPAIRAAQINTVDALRSE